MDGLRWWLLLFGALVVGGVYLYSRREKLKQEEPQSFDRVTPTLDGDAEPDSGDTFVDEGITDPGPADEESASSADDGGAPAQQKIVTLRLVARNRGSFKGDELILSMRGIGLRRGKFGIFHRCDGDDDDAVIFSAASLVEPGHFDIENIKEQSFPGISLFLVLPGPVEGVEGFDLMMATARTLAQSLDGELLDESGSTLSIQRERYMREEIVQFEHSHKVA